MIVVAADIPPKEGKAVIVVRQDDDSQLLLAVRMLLRMGYRVVVYEDH